MKKKHVYTDILLWEGSSPNWNILNDIVNNILENYDFIANQNDGLYLDYSTLNSLTIEERKQLYQIGEKYLIHIHITGYLGAIEGEQFAYTLNKKGYIDR